MINPDKSQGELISIYQNKLIQEIEEKADNFARKCDEQREAFTGYVDMLVLETEQMSQLFVKKMNEKIRTINVLSIALLCFAASTAVFAVAFFSSAKIPITLITLGISLVTVISISVVPWGLIKERFIDRR